MKTSRTTIQAKAEEAIRGLRPRLRALKNVIADLEAYEQATTAEQQRIERKAIRLTEAA